VKVVRGLPASSHRSTPGAVTIGVFDGVHRGHLAILGVTLERARRRRGPAVVITFDRHPLATLAPGAAPRCLMTLAQRLDRFKALGFGTTIVLPFTRALARRSAPDFVRTVLAGRLHVADVVVGYDFHFGHRGKGDGALLARLGRTLGFAVTVVPPTLDRGEPISSTRIRHLIRLGRVTDAARLLGGPVVVTGTRIHGRRLGRKLGFPTINFRPCNELLPPHGIYAARLQPGGAARSGPSRTVPAVAYLGARPTVDREGSATVLEVHCLGAVPRIPVGAVAATELVAFQRADRKFAGLGPLRSQIARDVARARRILGVRTAPAKRLTRGRRRS